MKYIINTIIVFDPVTRDLVLKNDPQLSVELSKPASRLLCEFIEYNNVTLVREDIIKSVWEDYGFTPSKGNLSNSISELRKAFESLGLNKEIIITVPRTGFKMEADIHPVIKDEEATSERVTEVIKPASTVPPPLTSTDVLSRIIKPVDRRIAQNSRPFIAGSVFITMIVGLIFFMWPKSEQIRLITTIGMCNIFGLNNTKPSSDFTINVNKMIEAEGVNCINESADIYYADPRPGNSLLKIRFMAVCRDNGTSKYQNCTNYKVVK
jgi:DNA-binding winged helix-turn-helix (wHTH) protein